MMIKDTEISKNLKFLRKKFGYTQQELTVLLQLKGVNITRSTYAKLECSIQHVHLDTLKALKEVYGMSYEDILD